MSQSTTPLQCPVCQCSRTVTIGPTHGGYYQRCCDCDLEIRMVDDNDSVAESFQNAQESFYGEDSSFESSTIRLLNRQVARSRLKIIQNYLHGGRLIEIGPGTGELLRQAQANGYDVSAIEHAPRFAEKIKDSLGVPVYCGMLEEMSSPEEKYDAVVSMQVIEHVPDPLSHLRSSQALVHPNGFLFLSTPNVGGWIRWLSRNRWPDYSEAHIHLFNSHNLGLCLKHAGWRLVGVHTTQHVFDWLRALARMAQKPREVRTARQAMTVTSSTPYLLAVTALNSLAFASWPIRQLQSLTGGGSELFIVARAIPKNPE